MVIRSCITKIFFMVSVLLSHAALSEPLPKWEIGLGLGGLTLANYRGSREYQSRALPIPFLIYRGDFLKADRGGVRGVFFSSDQRELNISLNASLTGTSDDSPLRNGMPELDPTFEIGPAYDINLSGSDLKQGWLFRLPARAVFAFNEESLRQIGWLLNPTIAYRSNASGTQWRLRYSTGIYIGDRDYHDFYYTVAPRFATATRPAFEADPGYSGLSTQINISKRTGNIWYGAYLRYDNLSGTAFENSPLVETDHYFAAGVGISWIFGQSQSKLRR